MATKKKLIVRGVWAWLSCLVVAATAGCGPAGPRALLHGKRHLEKGNYEDAIKELKQATSLMRTNANAWNYLGLAYHHAGQAGNAIEAYQRALKEDRDSALAVIHYNLGSLLLEQNRPDSLEAARNEFTAFTLREGNSLDGWLKLGTAQSRLGELTAAEKSFNEARRISPRNAEAWNDLGVIQMKRNRQREAAGFFGEALKLQPDYGPALLNLALVSQQFLNNRPVALEKFHEYLALKPRPANWAEVNAVAQQLEMELHQPPHTATNGLQPRIPITNAGHPVAQPPPPVTNVQKPAISAPPPKAAPPQEEHQARTEVVQVAGSRPVQPVQETVSKPNPPPSTNSTGSDPDEPPSGLGVRTEKRGFLQKINPLNLFHHDSSKGVQSPSPLPPMSLQEHTNTMSGSNNAAAKLQQPNSSRYLYVSPPRPAAGDRARAEIFFAEAADAEHNRRTNDAEKLYRAAAGADPSFFEAQSNLGLAAYDAGDMPQSLLAYETALAINPDSFNTRYNFALALKKAGYMQDAAEQLERLLAAHPTEAPNLLAMAQLALANLYAEQFHRPAYARPHYLKVLELDPQNPQATTIRYWLRDNP